MNHEESALRKILNTPTATRDNLENDMIMFISVLQYGTEFPGKWLCAANVIISGKQRKILTKVLDVFHERLDGGIHILELIAVMDTILGSKKDIYERIPKIVSKVFKMRDTLPRKLTDDEWNALTDGYEPRLRELVEWLVANRPLNNEHFRKTITVRYGVPAQRWAIEMVDAVK